MRGWRWLAIVPLVLGLELALAALVAGEVLMVVIAGVLLAAAPAIWRMGGGTLGELARVVRWLAIFPLAFGCQILAGSVLYQAWFGLVLAGVLLAAAAIIWRGFGGTWSVSPRAGRR